MARALPSTALLLLALSACGARSAAPVAQGTRAAAPSRAASPAAPRRAPLAVAPARAAVAYALSAAEPEPAAKALAARVAVALTTYAPTDTAASVAARVTTDASRGQALAASLAPLFHAGQRSTGSVVYPQLGGLTTSRASVMVVTRQVVAGTTETRVLDVRLLRGASGWAFDALASAGGTPVARPATLSAEARAVVDDPRIVLPDSARWDIYRGAVAPALLRLMAAIAVRTPYAVTVLETGHPYDVFGTSHMSAHTRGHAVDINTLGGTVVADQQHRGSGAYDLVTWLLARGDVDQVGSPWDLDGGSRRSFTNTVHLDHVHVAV